MTRFCTTGLLALALTAAAVGQPGKDALKTVTYAELGQQVRALKGKVPELYAVGDCVAPRGVHQAILDGTRVARAI